MPERPNPPEAERLYLLRVWREAGRDWEVSLKDLKTNRVEYFHSLDALLDWITALRGQGPERDHHQRGGS